MPDVLPRLQHFLFTMHFLSFSLIFHWLERETEAGSNSTIVVPAAAAGLGQGECAHHINLCYPGTFYASHLGLGGSGKPCEVWSRREMPQHRTYGFTRASQEIELNHVRQGSAVHV